MYFFDERPEKKEKIFLYSDKGEIITYGDLDKVCKQFGKKMKARRLAFLLCKNNVESVLFYMACLRNRVVPLLLDAKMDYNLIENLKGIYEPDYMYAPKEDGSYELIEFHREKDTLLNDALGLLLTTSGSTGSPKLVRQSYENIQSNAEAIAEYLNLNETERPITTLPMNYTYGLSIINSHAQCGAAILLTEYSVFQTEFWNFFRKGKATSFGGVPFTYEMLKKLRFFNMDLPSLKTMTQAGGKLPKYLHEAFASYAKETGKQFIVMYGQTEATARMSYLPAEKSLEKIGSIGIPIPGGAFFLEDEELIYKGKNVTLGYATKKEDLAKEDEHHGILHTGDLARKDADGYFYIMGRKKRFLKILGSRVNLDEVEQLLQETYEGTRFACTGEDDCLEVYVENPQIHIEEAAQYLSRKMKLNESVFHIYKIDAIPMNQSGKTLYEELRRR